VRLTHVGLVLERELTVITSAMEMGGPLPVERAIRRPAFLGRAEPLESFLYDGRVFAVVIRVHLHVGRAYVHLVARALYVHMRNTRYQYVAVVRRRRSSAAHGGLRFTAVVLTWMQW